MRRAQKWLKFLAPSLVTAAAVGLLGALAAPAVGVARMDGAQMALSLVGVVLLIFGSYPRSRAAYAQYMVKGGFGRAEYLNRQDERWAREEREWSMYGWGLVVTGLVCMGASALLYVVFGQQISRQAPPAAAALYGWVRR